VGDEVELGGDNFEARWATVTGLAVLPALGPFESDRASPGDGMVLPATMLDPAYASQLTTFVGVDLVEGADTGAALTTLRQEYPAWRADPFTVDYSRPVRPAEIVNAQGMRAVPLLVGGLLGVTVVVGLSLAVFVSVRARRRELGILRALGFTGRQLRDSVRVQAVVTILGALAMGVPAGLIVGRFAWRAFASGLAVVQPPSTPAGWILATVAGAVVVALAAASVPARMASRARAADVLRSE
jgi:predicted lysophospholipase L1 biosynthesis ABC-type transport system permease subunit